MKKFNIYTIAVKKVVDLKEGRFKVEFEYETAQEEVLKKQIKILTGRLDDFMEMLGIHHIDASAAGVNLIKNTIKCKLIKYEHGAYNLILAITDLQTEKNYLVDYGIFCDKKFLEVTLKCELMKDLYSRLEHIKDYKMDSSNLRIQELISEILSLEEFKI